MEMIKWNRNVLYSIRFVLLSNISVTIETNFINYQNWQFAKQIISKQQRCIWTIHTTSKLTTSVLPIPKIKSYTMFQIYVTMAMKASNRQWIYIKNSIFKANYLPSAKVNINNSYRV